MVDYNINLLKKHFHLGRIHYTDTLNIVKNLISENLSVFKLILSRIAIFSIDNKLLFETLTK